MDRSEQLIALLKRCTARVLTSSDTGAGFFVAPGHLLTCAHVVEDEALITISWEGKTYSANVVNRFPHPYPDLALLQVADLTDHPCVFLHNEVHVDDPLYCYGYPENYPQGDPTSLVFEGVTGSGSDPSPLLTFKMGDIRPGFSGSALLNRRTGAVCGLVKLTRGPNTVLGGRGVPTNIILQYLPDLTARQTKFHQQDSRWYDALSDPQRTLLALKPQTTTYEVYYSFVQNDADLATRLRRHLVLLERRELIKIWDSDGSVGYDRDAVNRQHLDTAQIILLLVSNDFILDKDDEVEIAMERSKAGARVIPIMLRASHIDLARFGNLVRLPRDGRPIFSLTDKDEAFTKIAKEIYEIVKPPKQK